MPFSQRRKAVFTISLDFELAWGTLDRHRDSFYRPICRAEREQAITRLLDLFASYDICATWATVGALFEEGSDDLLHAPDLIEEIRRCRVTQEIGSHTYTHPVMTKVTREQARRQFELSVDACERVGITPKTIIFPRNQVAHLDEAKRVGFTCYRSPEPRWYCAQGERGAAERMGHLADVLTASTPAVVMPRVDEHGLIGIPGSMLYTPSFGIRKYIPAKLRALRAKRGLRAAVEQTGIFHLWFHPTDIVIRMDDMLAGLAEIFEAVHEYRRAGQLEVRSMAGVAAEWQTAGSLEQAIMSEDCCLLQHC